ncbi:MAG: hypothetical protein R3C42_03350 [Parvularculaceae bacterium]
MNTATSAQGASRIREDYDRTGREGGEIAGRSLAQLVEKLIELGVERNDTVIAFGGGVVGDLAGFAAAIVKRGCRFTANTKRRCSRTGRSAVGGKTAVNSAHGKNLIGAFHQPTIVLADISALSTLPVRELKAGYAEIVKYGALGDGPILRLLEQRGRDIVSGDATARRIAVKRMRNQGRDRRRRREKGARRARAFKSGAHIRSCA